MTEWIKDQLQDFFVYLWEHRSNLSRDVNTRSYLLTAFKQLINNAAKKNLLLKPVSDLEWHAAVEQDADAESFTEQFGKVQKAIGALSPAQKEVVELRYIQNMSLQEIADHRGLLRKGMRADLLILNKDPLQNLSVLFSPETVIRKGVIFSFK